ncbi:MAG: PIN domain-containing protein [Nitrospira sp.]|nr:MAG: PIN domain-containing protein [Nitrospira sp.]
MALPALVFCDTTFFYACLNPKDANHTRARILVAESASAGTTWCATGDIVSETVTLLRYRRNFRAALAFLSDVKPWLQIVPDARDHRLSFCDAISCIVVTSLLNHAPCFTFDEDFRRLGLTVLP